MQTPGGRVPPHNLEAEQALLGGLLLDNAAIDRVVELVGHEDFYREAHAKIFRAILDLTNRSEPVDLLTLSEALKVQGTLGDVGGPTYLSELTDRAVSAANTSYYARIIREKATLRALIATASEIATRGYEGREEVDLFLDQAEHAIYQIAERKVRASFTKVGDMIVETFKHIEELYQRKEMVTGVATGFVDLDRMTAGLQPSDLIIVAGRPSMGKCVAGDTEIVLDDGRVETIESLCSRREGGVWTLGDDWRLKATRPTDFLDQGEKAVFRLTTALGRRITATANHPFRTLAGWKALATLSVGESIATPRELPAFGETSIGSARARLLGYLIGDGGLTGTCPHFTHSNPRVLADFVDAVGDFGGLTVHDDRSGRNPVMALSVSRDRVWLERNRKEFGDRLRAEIARSGTSARRLALDLGVSPSLVTHWVQGATVPSPGKLEALQASLGVSAAVLCPQGVAAIAGRRPDPLRQWLADLGLWGARARDQFVPEVVFRLRCDEVAVFLNRLFATDGWATVLSSGQPQLGFATVSERLARQVQHLLLRFGVIASLRRRRILYRGERRLAFQVSITDASSIERFLDRIGIFGKEAALERLRRAVAARRTRRGDDAVPAEIWVRIEALRGRRSWREVGGLIGLPSKGQNLHAGRRGLSRRRLRRFGEVLDAPELVRLAESDVYWDRIVSIEPAGRQRVYDLTVPATHNFVANDLFVHNSSFVLNIAEHVAIEKGTGVAVFSLEMSKEQLVLRMLCSQARVDLAKVRTGFLSARDFPKLATAAGRIADAPVYIDDTPALSALELRAKARRLKRDPSANLGLVVVDYLQLMRGSAGSDSREQEISEISRSLKALAKELHLPVIALSQLNRQVEQRNPPKPRMADLRESGAIEQDADVIAFIYRDEVYNLGNEGKAEIIVAKQRNGPTGEVTLAFRSEYTRFENLEEDFGEPPAGGEEIGGGEPF